LNGISFPLARGAQGPAVADLQAALQLLLDRGLLLAQDPAGRQQFSGALQHEAAENSSYGVATAKLVGLFQAEHRLQTTDAVDEATAAALNDMLRQLGVLDGGAPPAAPVPRVVSGQVLCSDGLPFAHGVVQAFHGPDRPAVRLGQDVADAQGRYTIRYDPLPDGGEIDLWVVVSGPEGAAVATSPVRVPAGPAEVVDVSVPLLAVPGSQRRVEGRILLAHGLPPQALGLRLYRHGFGGAAQLVAETVTGDGGLYALPYDLAAPEPAPPGQLQPVTSPAASLEVRAVDAAGREYSLSAAMHDLGASPRAVVNLVAPSALQPLAPEFQRLAADVAPHVGAVAQLASAREDADRQDLTLLNRATGWDARLLALASTAAALTADPDVGLPHDVLYALLRTGLPSDKLQLAQVPPTAVDLALRKAGDAGIVQLDDAARAAAAQQFTAFSRKIRLAIPAPGSQATYGELLQASGVSPAAQAAFADVYLDHRGDGAALWASAEAAGVGADDIGVLRQQGKLAFLTRNSAAVATHLRQDLGIRDPADLVEHGLYAADAWEAQLTGLAGADDQLLAALIPTAYQADTVAARLGVYAEDMARRVRLSYPTHVVAHMIGADPQDPFVLGADRTATAMVLKSAAAQGFRFGQVPVSAFIAAHGGVFAGAGPGAREPVTRRLKSLQRVYQISPRTAVMPILMKLGFTSAYDVVSLSHDEFLARHGHEFASLDEASLTHRKAQQVSSVTYNLFTVAKALGSDLPVRGATVPAAVAERRKQELRDQFPTLEALFGSQDFCECENCESVLGPAAYLVALLQFLDPEAPEWNGFLARWKADHGGADYLATYQRPYEALTERRPDLPYIPLTCENTNTTLPYIDVVNEILEYFVAHGALDPAAARDTSGAASAELLAEPQNVIAAAYTTLQQAQYPLGLPFDLWIETVRQLGEYFGQPLAEVLDAFRPGDDLYAPGQRCDRAAVFAESLGLSPAEYGLFTDPDAVLTWHKLYGYGSAAEAMTPAADPDTGQRVDLNSAKALARRLELSYTELADVVRAGFVNPKLNTLVVLSKIGIAVHDVVSYHDHQTLHDQNKDLIGKDPASLAPADRQRYDALTRDQWEQILQAEAVLQRLHDAAAEFAATGFDAHAWLSAALADNTFDDILVLADPDAGCDFDQTILSRAGGTAAQEIDFLRINLFVRLWRKLGWTIEETDRALQAFVPATVPFDLAHVAEAPLKTALLSLAHFKTLDARLRVGKQSRLKLLTLWGDLATTGTKPLYQQLFLTRSILKADPVFDDPLGCYLTAPGLLVRDHLPALQSALGLSAEQITAVLTDAGLPPDTAALTLATCSLLYRHGLLAKAIGLSVADLIALKHLSGLDPFSPPAPATVTSLEADHPYSQTLRFLDAADAVKASGLTVPDLQYLLRQQSPTAGPGGRPDAGLDTIRTLAQGIRAVRADHAAPDAATGITDERLRAELSLALPPDTVDRLMGMLDGTAEFTATKTGVAPADQLAPAAFAADPAIRAVSYNEVRRAQKLTVRGVLFDDRKAALEAALPVAPPPGPHVPSPLFAELLDDVQAQARSFFDATLRKARLRVDDDAGFLDDAQYQVLFEPLAAPIAIDPADTDAQAAAKQAQNQATDEANFKLLAARRLLVAQAFLPFLQSRLIRQLVTQTLTARAGADPDVVDGLLTDARLLAEPGTAAAPQPLLPALTASAERGVTAAFYPTADASGPAQSTVTLADADTTLALDGGPAKPAGTGSARFDGYLEVPAAGAYRFTVVLGKAGATAELLFPDLPAPIVLQGTAAADGAEVSGYLELAPNLPHRFTLTVTQLAGGDARALVQGETLAKDGLGQLALAPRSAVGRAERALLLLTNALRIIDRLGLTAREVRHLLTHSADFGGLSLSALPTQPADDTPAAAAALFAQFLRLVGYTQLKQDLAAGSDDLIGVFEAPTAAAAYPLIAALTRSDDATVQAVAEALTAAPVFHDELATARLWRALRVVERFGVPVASVVAWTGIVSPTATPDQRFAAARDLKDAVKARFDPESWLRAARPIFDRLRQRQRDALVGYVMQHSGFANVDQLYEYFLIDPGMEPAVQTSRIRLAIASVQLFVQRCLLSMEKSVPPGAINAKQWEVMKSFQVRAANLQLFLRPENWLEPEFRDDKTHLFAELEGALLQGEITNDLVEDAFLAYLKKLEAMAHLDIAAMHLEDRGDPARNVLHVIGRTNSHPRKHFYRQYAHDAWTPWEPVTAEIEGDHLAPVVWRDRLYLFWATFLAATDKPASAG